jgi:antitoxin MazE
MVCAAARAHSGMVTTSLPIAMIRRIFNVDTEDLMHVPLRRWGNSLALRIPKAWAEELGVRDGSMVDVAVTRGKLIAEPVRAREVPLRSLLAKVTPANRHAETDWGRLEGDERW